MIWPFPSFPGNVFLYCMTEIRKLPKAEHLGALQRLSEWARSNAYHPDRWRHRDPQHREAIAYWTELYHRTEGAIIVDIGWLE